MFDNFTAGSEDSLFKGGENTLILGRNRTTEIIQTPKN